MTCTHERMVGEFHLNRLEGEDGRVENYIAEIKIHCDVCHKPFRFLGLPIGLDLRGACVSPDALEARLAILPKGEPILPIGGVVGFDIQIFPDG